MEIKAALLLLLFGAAAVVAGERESHTTSEATAPDLGSHSSKPSQPIEWDRTQNPQRTVRFKEIHTIIGGLDYGKNLYNHPASTKSEKETAASYFTNKYTFEIRDAPNLSASELDLIEINAIAVIEYISDYISWRGTLDFVVQFRPFDYYDVGGRGLLPSFGGIAESGFTWAAEEALTGVDANGSYPDIGCNILPNEDGRLTNYDVPLHFDATPNFYEAYSPPPGTHDFASIFLHEVLHSLAFWSMAQHGSAKTAFDELTTPIGDRYEFIGGNTTTLLRQNLKLAYEGSRDHYAATEALIEGEPNVDRGAMFMFGNYEQNRWHLGKLELAVLKDIGFTVANEEVLYLVEQPEAEPSERPVQASQKPQRAFLNLLDTLRGARGP